MENAEHDVSKHHHVRIHINREPHEAPNPTTGEALYLLGNVSAKQQLYREVQGDEEDEPIENDNATVHLKEDEHFYSAECRKRDTTIIVNGREKVVEAKRLTFAEIVGLADNLPSGPDVVYTVTFRHGPSSNREGTLVVGETVNIKDGMVFNVTATNKS